MSKLVSISTAVEARGVSTSTMHRWEACGRLTPARTESGQRRYELTARHSGARHSAPANRKTVNDVQVSSHERRDDMERQAQVPGLSCAN